MFWLTMGYETHPNDSQQVFVDLFLYTTVVKWTRKNKNVFVYVKCFYVTVGLKSLFFKNNYDPTIHRNLFYYCTLSSFKITKNYSHLH
jgi:hypothetical protein